MKKLFILLSFIALSLINICFSQSLDRIDYYQDRYMAYDLNFKVVDNRGNGFDDLYGTRNLRAVLKGLLYRGGANNYYHQHNRRSNINPLPDDGISNLCQEGFSSAVYLYSENFETAPHHLSCETRINESNNFNYYNYKSLSSLSQLKSIFKKV